MQVAIIKTNISELYTLVTASATKTGFVELPIVLADGTKIAGLYRGFGATVLVTRAPKNGEKGFRALGPIAGDPNGNVYIQD